jgi:hypothetical protein
MQHDGRTVGGSLRICWFQEKWRFRPHLVCTWVVGVVAIFIGESCAAQPGSKCRGVMQLNGTANADFPGVATKASSLTL